jgi:hypothetical protein
MIFKRNAIINIDFTNDEYKNLEITEEQITESYLGVVMQSNWDAPYFGAPLKY